MSRDKCLEQLATNLFAKDNQWFKGNKHYFKVLQAIIRDEGKCVYCGKPLWEEFGVPSCGDHLLPQSIYPSRAGHVDNLVFACAECNAIKLDYDPSENGTEPVITDTTEITDQLRERLIAKAHAYIEDKRTSNDWRNAFKTAKPLLHKAIAEYREYKR